MKKKYSLSKKDFVYLAVIFLLVVALTLVSVLFANSKKKTEPSYYDMKCNSFSAQNFNLSKGQIVFIGDSITDFYPLDDFYADLPLATYNRGIGGDTTEGVLNRLKVSLYDLQPSKIVLMIGTNDVNGRKSHESTVTNYRRILQNIRENLPSVELYCMSLIPLNDVLETYANIDTEESTRRILALNTEIPTLAEEFNATYLNIFPLLADENNRLIETYSDDGLHLNTAGFQVWTALIKPYLQ